MDSRRVVVNPVEVDISEAVRKSGKESAEIKYHPDKKETREIKIGNKVKLGYLSQKNENISLATTYRTLKLLSQFGYLRELDFAEGHKHYELNKEKRPHHHIICLNCNKTMEFEDELVNQVGYRIAQEKGVEVVDIQFKIYAVCAGHHDDENKTHRS